MLDGTFKRANYSQQRKAVGRIKCGTESNGGFRAITISNCILDGCRGFALETVDGAFIEDITVTNLVLRGAVHAPIFLRLGTRMRGPKGVAPGSLRRVVLSNFTSYGSAAEYPSIISGVPGCLIEDIKISDMYLSNFGGGTSAWATIEPPENEAAYPEASMFGTLPARGFLPAPRPQPGVQQHRDSHRKTRSMPGHLGSRGRWPRSLPHPHWPWHSSLRS
jgi:polygalacturonase